MLSTRFKEDNIIEIGIDEAGRGSFWGPLMAGALIIPEESSWTENQRELLSQLCDSKKITPKKRNKLYDEIKELIPQTAVGIVSAEEINEKGINWANIEAFRRAIYGLGLEDITKCRLLIDGVLSIDNWIGEQELIIEGDGKISAIAGASILAKVEHDRWIQNYCKEHPECNERYDLLSCNGYGTLKHRNGIKTYGGHKLHRSLYIQNWLPEATHIVKTKTKKKNNNNNKFLIKL
jgi:ribonuclease HII